MLRYFAITLVSILFSLYLFEGFLPYKEKISQKQLLKEQILKEQLFEEKTGKKWDKRSRIQIYNDLKKINNNITIRFQPSYFLGKKNHSIFPLSGISNSETIHCNENGYFSIYNSDRHGFNNPDEEWNNEETEYLLIGDSFTHGSCVNRPNDIASVLRTLSNKSILNLGYGGNGPMIEYATLKEYINPNIKNVLWIYCESNDLYDLGIERKNKNLAKYLDADDYSQDLKNRQAEVDKLLNNSFKLELKKKINNNQPETQSKKAKDNKLKYKILKFIRLDKTKKLFFNKDTKYEDIIFNEFEMILKKSINLSEANNSKFIFVYIPEYRRYNSDYSDENYNKIVSIVKKLDIKFIDIRKTFDNENNPKIFFPFQQFAWHYNAEGYKKVAETIYKFTKG
tara:strand:+ start:1353 stop:2540 length:1188 start_codon:yes stop_codon:yes gene_type:complete